MNAHTILVVSFSVSAPAKHPRALQKCPSAIVTFVCQFQCVLEVLLTTNEHWDYRLCFTFRELLEVSSKGWPYLLHLVIYQSTNTIPSSPICLLPASISDNFLNVSLSDVRSQGTLVMHQIVGWASKYIHINTMLISLIYFACVAASLYKLL